MPPKNNVAVEKGKCFRRKGNNLESLQRRSFDARQHCFRGAGGRAPFQSRRKRMRLKGVFIFTLQIVSFLCQGWVFAGGDRGAGGARRRLYLKRVDTRVGKSTLDVATPAVIPRRMHRISSPVAIPRRIHRISSPAAIPRRMHRISSPAAIPRRMPNVIDEVAQFSCGTSDGAPWAAPTPAPLQNNSEGEVSVLLGGPTLLTTRLDARLEAGLAEPEDKGRDVPYERPASRWGLPRKSGLRPRARSPVSGLEPGLRSLASSPASGLRPQARSPASKPRAWSGVSRASVA